MCLHVCVYRCLSIGECVCVIASGQLEMTLLREPLPVMDDGEVGLCLQFDIWGFLKFSFTL